MTLYETFETSLHRAESQRDSTTNSGDEFEDNSVTVLYSLVLGRRNHDIQVEAVWKKGEVIMPFGQEPNNYKEKPRIYNEARSDLFDKYYKSYWNDE